MAAHAGLPDLNTLEVFSYYDPDLGTIIPIISDDDTHPRIIEDYVIDPKDWQTENRGVNHGNGFGVPNGINTVEEILTYRTGNLVCFVCGQKGKKCNGEACVDVAKYHFQHVAESKLEIRQAQFGYGVFARENIPRGKFIGEYLGRLLPLDPVNPAKTRYVFNLEGRSDCDAELYGNITRYVNHNCKCNTDPLKVMYGKRDVIAFQTNRDIAAGEEILIDYGTGYFNSRLPCQCDALPYPHTSETYRRHIYPDGTVSPTGWGTYGHYRGRGQRRGGPCAGSLPILLQKTTKGQDSVAGKSKVSKSRPKSGARGKASASKVRRRRRSWGSEAYKGGDPDWASLRRSARIAAMNVDA